MKSLIVIALVVVVGWYGATHGWVEKINMVLGKPSVPDPELAANGLEFSSPAFENNHTIPLRFTCDGENINPPLVISGTPVGTKSLVLIVDDPDAAVRSWVHWLVFNIGPGISFINEDSIPAGARQGLNNFGKPLYQGPCPPEGMHHYVFRLYALDQVLNLGTLAKRSEVDAAMQGHILGYSQFVGTYNRIIKDRN